MAIVNSFVVIIILINLPIKQNSTLKVYKYVSIFQAVNTLQI